MESIWQRLSWPQVAALAILVIGAVAALYGVPLATWQGLPWEAIAGLVAVIVGGGASSMLGPLVRPRSTSTPPPPAPARLDNDMRDADGRPITRPKGPPPSRSGHVDLDVLGWIIAWVVAFAVATWHAVRSGLIPLGFCLALVAGCGAGAIQVQARAATIATVALEGAHRAAMEVTDQRVRECPDEACVDAVGERMAPMVLAYESARAGLVTWVEAIQIAQVAGEDGDVVGALITAAARWVADLWPALVEAIEAVADVDLPELPPFVTGLIAALAGR